VKVHRTKWRGSNLAKLTYSPLKEIIVHDIQEMDIQRLLVMAISQVESQKQGGTPTLLWMDEIAFTLTVFPETPEITSDKLKGIMHYAVVNFAKSSYDAQKKVALNGRESVVRMLKLEGEKNPDLRKLVRFLSTFKPGLEEDVSISGSTE
jgi:hypothetical protein